MSIRVIQIGVGGFGTSWQHALTSLPGLDVVALADIDAEALAQAADLLAVPAERCFLNSDDWADVDADMLLDATPQLRHHANAMRAFASGKHLLVVKPMSDGWDMGLAMVREAEERGLKMAVAQQLRFHPVIVKIREMVQSGVLGKVGMIHMDMLFGRTGYQGSYPQTYPVLVQSAIHHFDYLRWVLDEEATSVWADCWKAPWNSSGEMRCTHVNIQMAGGCRVLYRGLATDQPSTNWTCDWSIEGEKGILTVQQDQLQFNGEPIPVGCDDDTDISDLNLSVLNRQVFEQFLDYLNGGEEPGFSGRRNLGSLEMVFGAIRSYETGTRYQMG